MDLEGVVSEERSAVVEQWFGPLEAGQPVWGYLGRGDATFAARTEQAWTTLATAAGRAHVQQALRDMPSRLQVGERTFELVYRAVEGGGRLERVVLVVSDVTVALANERSELKMEAELRQAQKLESVGRLASGIAHEINTPVQFVADSCRFLRDGIADVKTVMGRYQAILVPAAGTSGAASEALAAVAEAEQAVDLPYLLEHMPSAADRAIEGLERVATIVRAMKEFAHPDTKEMIEVDLNQALASTLIIARNEYKYVAEVQTDLGALPPVVCHPGEVNQVFLNILVNAAHAIGERVAGGGGRGLITVATRLDGDAVVVAIGDSGNGIPACIRERIFDPFFTTKEVGKGTGQGLWLARSAVCDKHGGQLTFETELGKGTTFFVRLPVAGKAAPAAAC